MAAEKDAAMLPSRPIKALAVSVATTPSYIFMGGERQATVKV